MYVNTDFKSLEVVTAAWLSQDAVMMQEILDGTDMHTANQVTFKLPGWEDALAERKTDKAKLGRGVAKTLKFRVLYGGSAYSFSKDPDFTPVSKSVQFWEDVIEQYYTKYKGLKRWHDSLIRIATSTGKLETPFGRTFCFEPKKNYRGEMEWPITTVKNYPVQSAGADIVCMSRVMIYRRMRREGLKSLLVSTVHDSIVADCPDDEVDIVASIFKEEIDKTPRYLSSYYGVDFNLPLVGEVEVGKSMGQVEKV